MDTLRIGIIGLGFPGKEHLKHYTAMDEAEVVALCDVDEKLTRQQADLYSVPNMYTDYREMIARDDIDAVSVCLPNFLHCPVTCEVLEAGKHVFCEKPPAISAAEAQKMADTAKENGRLLMYAFCLRFSPQAKYVHSLAGKGEFGDIYLGKATYYRRSGIPVGAGGWFVDKQRSGGGALVDIGVHPLDCVWWLMGTPKPVSVFGTAYQKFGHTIPKEVKYDVDDSAFALIKFENEATLILECSWALFRPNASGREIAGTKGGASLDPLIIMSEREGTHLDITPTLPKEDMFENEVRHFVNCALDKEQPVSTAEQGVHLMKMIEAVYKSAATGREVRLS